MRKASTLDNGVNRLAVMYLLAQLCLGKQIKKVSLRIPYLNRQALESLQGRHETTSPRILREPSHSVLPLFEFSRFGGTRQKRNASISTKSTANARMQVQ